MNLHSYLHGLLLAFAMAAAQAVGASECQDFCNQQQARCVEHYCTPVSVGCAGGCSLWFTNYPNMCASTCGNEALTPCRRAVMERAAKCWEGCWRQKGLGLDQYGRCMAPCNRTAEAEFESCRQGGALPPWTGPGPSPGGSGGAPGSPGAPGQPGPWPGDGSAYLPPPAGPVAGGRCCGDGNCPEAIERIRAGRTYHMVFDLTYAKFDDARYTGNHLTDPLGTIKGGQTYRCQYRGGEFACAGFNQGTGGIGTWSYRNADPCQLQVSLWGRVFTLCGDKIIDGQHGIVGHVLVE